MPLSTGFVLNNRYRIVKLLGQGGFGAVYRAWDTSLERPCAIKENLGTTDEAQRQFKREATILANVVHPNLPRVTDHFIIPSQGQYLVMDYVEGEDLHHMLERTGGPLPTQQAVSWILQVCDALSYLHSQNPPIIHRDIKPANIRITPGGQAMLVDFGIAKIFDPHQKTTTGARAITPGFSPPEQYGQGTTDIRSDVYALGATLYTLLTNQIPPDSVNLISGNVAAQMAHELNPQVPAYVSQAITKATQVHRTARFQNTQEFKAALQRLPVEAKQYVSPVRVPPSYAPGATPVAPTIQASFPSTPGPIPTTSAAQDYEFIQPKQRRNPWILVLGGLIGLAILVTICFTAFAALSNIFSNSTRTPSGSELSDTPTIQNAYMATDQDGNSPSTTFKPEDDLYAIVEVANAQEEVMLKSVWIAKDARGMEPDTIIHEYERSVTSGKYWMKNTNTEGSRGSGSYLVELHLNDELQQTLAFEVHAAEGPRLENLVTAYDKDGAQTTTVFGPNDTFYVVGTLVNAPDEVDLKAVWTAADVEEKEPNTYLGEYEISFSEGGFWYSLAPDPYWNNGTYRVEMYINGELVETLEFEVR